MGPVAVDFEGEEWRDIPGLSYYQASNFGRVRSWRKARWGRADHPRLLTGSGRVHLAVNVVEDSGRKTPRLVHKLVLIAFKGHPPQGMVGCHNDGNSKNNHLSNLRWDTYQGNEADKIPLSRDNRGDRHGNAKLTWVDVESIRSDPRGPKALAAAHKVSRKTISNIRSWKSWRQR